LRLPGRASTHETDDQTPNAPQHSLILTHSRGADHMEFYAVGA